MARGGTAMSGLLAGKIALVTGGSSGIGRTSALVLAREGAKVVIGSRRTEEGEETARLVRQAGGESIFVRTDVTVASDVAGLVGAAAAKFGRLDCAFNNAGMTGEMARTAECTEENWDGILNVN